MKKLVALFMAVVMAAGITGCGAGSNTKDSTAGEDGIVIATDVDIDALHPSDFSTTIEHTILSQIYDTLMFVNLDGTHDPEPRIAKKVDISEDGLAYTFQLRDDVTFHDGTKLTAEDVKFSLELYKNSEYQCSQVEGLSSVEVVDDQTVVCHLDTPYSPFLLGVCQCNIASKAYYEADAEKFVTEPVGSGPYKFVSRAKGSKITLEAYEKYYRGKAEIENVSYSVIPDQSTTAVSLKTGEVDLALIEPVTLGQLKDDDKVQIEEVETSGFAYISMNTEKAPFDDVRVRQAINYAIDRQNIISVIYDGEAEENSNVCAKNRFGYSEDQQQYTYDLDKAKELLAEAGYADGYDLGTLLVAERHSALATVIQSDLAKAGLTVKVEVKEFNAYIGDLTSGNYDITALEMTLDGDSQNLEMAFTTDYIGTANNARYSDAAMDDFFAQAKVETDTEKRAEIFDKALSKAQEEAVYAVIGNPLMIYAHSSDLQCGEFPFEGIYSLYNFSWK